MILRPYATLPFFLWGFLKEKVCSNNLRSLEELKHNSEWAVAIIDQKTLQKVAKNTEKCLQEGGGHFQHLL